MEQSEYETFAPSDFTAAGIQDVEKARQHLVHLAGNGVNDHDVNQFIPMILAALASSPDADRSISSFSRWFASLGNPVSHLSFLQTHPLALELFFQITGSSQYFSELFVRFPEYIELITNPGVRGGAKSQAEMKSQLDSIVNACSRSELKRDALRRWKAQEMLRIGVRDLSGYADMPATAYEFSNLADVCVQKALEMAIQESPLQAGEPVVSFIVVGMGKLGGQELNYSSDIDLIFVHGDNLPDELIRSDGRKIDLLRYTSRLSESIIKILGEDRADGHVFRVDMRLRPEGRFGPLARSLESHRIYYENWAESWERQSLLKARVIGGDEGLGERFMQMLEPFVYRKHVSGQFLEDLRENKHRIEKKCELEGGTLTNVKTGFGGIRDIEFLTQALQLEYGGLFSQLRTTNTLLGLSKLREKSILSQSEMIELSEDYIFLRNLEHRLQLLNGFQTQTMPSPDEPRERYLLSRRMGYSDLETFEYELNRRRIRVREHLKKRFYRMLPGEFGTISHTDVFEELADLLESIESPEAQIRMSSLLLQIGFRDSNEAIRALKMPISGNEYGRMPPDTSLRFSRIAPLMFKLLSASPDLDAGLAGLEKLATAVPNRAHLYASFEDSPSFLARTISLASGSPYLFQRLADNLEWLEAVISDEEEDENSNDRANVKLHYRKEEIAKRLSRLGLFEDKLKVLAKFYLRETLILGAKELWEESETERTSILLTELASTALQLLLEICCDYVALQHPDFKVAKSVLESVSIIGLGKLGGQELGHTSDWDLLFVYDPGQNLVFADSSRDGATEDIHQIANSLVQKILGSVKSLASYGAPVEIDLRLRPWGKDGALIYTPEAVGAYLNSEAEMWERQAAMKARRVAGSVRVGETMVQLIRAATFERGITLDEDHQIGSMKRRIETERLKSTPNAIDLKLGLGGMTDIEWLIQKIQLSLSKIHPQLIQNGTISALRAAISCGAIARTQAETLIDSYHFLTRLRNLIWLQSGHSQNILTLETHRTRALAILMGYEDSSENRAEAAFVMELKSRMLEVRTIFESAFTAQSQ